MIKRIIKIIKLFYPKPTFIFTEPIPLDEPIVFVANHEKNYGPSVMQLFFPISYRPWVIHNMLVVDDCQSYVGETFFVERLRWPVWISKIVSKLVATTLVRLMKFTNPVPVYREKPERIIETFRHSIKTLEQGDNLLIFPENPNAENYSEEVKNFFDGFLYLAKLYYRKTEKSLLFCPVSINPQSHTISVGKLVRYKPEMEFGIEAERLRKHLMHQIAGLYHQPWLSQRSIHSQELASKTTEMIPKFT